MLLFPVLFVFNKTMAHLSLKLFCVYSTLLFSAVASSQRWNGPPQTLPFAHQGSGLGWTPKPTAAPAWPELLRRQEAPHSICGYVDGNACTSSPPSLRQRNVVI